MSNDNTIQSQHYPIRAVSNQNLQKVRHLLILLIYPHIIGMKKQTDQSMSAQVLAQPQPPVDLSDDQARRDLARILAALFAKWELANDAQLALLGLSPESRKVLSQYRRGERALPNSRDTLDRAGYLLGVHKSLRLLFPEDEALRYRWVHLRNRLLGERTPLQVMLEDGLVGVARVARFVDFQRGQ